MLGELDRVDSVKALDNGVVMLAVLDDWGWDDPHEHMRMLRAKTDHYLERLLTGSLQGEFPQLDHEQYGFVLWFLLAEEYLPREAVRFFTALRDEIRELGGNVEVSHEDLIHARMQESQ